MNILQICNKVPFPPKDGGAKAAFSFTKSFKDLGHEVTVLAMNTSKHYFKPSKFPEEIQQMADFHLVNVDNRIKPLDAFVNMALNFSYNISRFISKEFKTELVRILKLKRFDVIQLEGLYLSPYLEIIRKHSRAKVAMRAHNVEHEIWQRIAGNETHRFKKMYLKILATQLKTYELLKLNDYDFLIPISERDAGRFRKYGCTIPVFVAPFGIDEDLLKTNSPEYIEEENTVCYIGSLDWKPNIEGIKWFLEKVWPKIRDHDITLYIAGRNTPDWLLNFSENKVKVIGEVDDALDFIRSKKIMIVPLFSGSGMRIKIIEGMALGKTIISTTLGAEGIDCENNKNILIADDEADFAAQILKCLDKTEFTKQIGENAEKLINEHYNAMNITKSLLNFYKSNLN